MTDDLDSEVLVNTPPAASIESGVESLTRSLSRLDSSSSSTHAHTPDYGEWRMSLVTTWFTATAARDAAGESAVDVNGGKCA